MRADRAADTRVFGFAVAAFRLLGLVEDMHGLPPGRRLIWQAAASAMGAFVLVSGLTASTVRVALLTGRCPIWITGCVNVLNLMDGFNGISAAHAIIAGVLHAGHGGGGTTGS